MTAIRSGLYLLVDESRATGSFWEQLPDVLASGVVLVQYRAKTASLTLRTRRAQWLAACCHDLLVPLLINDDPELVVRCGAAGVHLGQTDQRLAAARAALGPDALIGASCYNSLETARTAVASGADYVSFGRLFPSRTKPEAPPASLDILGQARGELAVPICAIGGINAQTVIKARRAGADLLCCADGVIGQADPVAAARILVARINETEAMT